MKLVPPDHPALRSVAAPVSDFEAAHAMAFDEMVPLMRFHGGVGLAAPQVGRSERVFVMQDNSGVVLVCINPELASHGAQQEDGREGCLSFPGVTVNKARWRVVTVSIDGPCGTRITRTLKGLEARVFQHEFDHLNGVCIVGST